MTDRTKLPLVSYANGISSGGVFYPYQAKNILASVALACTSPNQRIFLHTVSFMVASSASTPEIYDVSVAAWWHHAAACIAQRDSKTGNTDTR